MRYRYALVVDDDQGSRDALSAAVGRAGFEVTTAARGHAALAHLDEVEPDLVILDLSLPDIDGQEVCRRIRSSSDCYILLATERQNEIDLLLGLEAGADDFMRKPVSPASCRRESPRCSVVRGPRRPLPVPRVPSAPAVSRGAAWSSTGTRATSRSTAGPSISRAPSSTC